MSLTHKQCMLKSLIWRIMGVVVLAAVTYFFTRHWITTTYITFVHHATFLLVFYLHERLWIKLYNKDCPKRRIAKAVTYEIILGMGLGGLIVYFFTGEFSKVTEITGTYTVIKLIMYYIYEKVWRGLDNAGK